MALELAREPIADIAKSSIRRTKMESFLEQPCDPATHIRIDPNPPQFSVVLPHPETTNATRTSGEENITAQLSRAPALGRHLVDEPQSEGISGLLCLGSVEVSVGHG